MAQNSLRRRGLGLVFAMIALFAGIVALALGIVVTQSAQSDMAERTIHLQQENLVVIAPDSEETPVSREISNQTTQVLFYGYQASVNGIRLLSSDHPATIQPLLIGRSQPNGYELEGAAWGSAEGVYVNSGWGVETGDQVEVAFQDGSTRSLPVVGTYTIYWTPSSLPAQLGLLMPVEQLVRLTQPDTVFWYLQVPPAQLDQISASLGRSLKHATLLNLQAYADRYTQTYHNLFVLAVAMASLALLAGVLLIANSVSLAMLDRQYEIGVLKTIGYSRRHILASMAVEYSLVGLVASLAGIGAVQAFFTVLALSNNLAGRLFLMTPVQDILIGVCGVGLTLLTVIGFAYRPTQVSPSVVLNERI